MQEHLIPRVGQHRLYDLTSENTSAETKASTARWYAEMMIDLFFSERGKSIVGDKKFNSLSLGEKIKIIKEFHSSELIDALNIIKNFGDKASHYYPDRKIDTREVEKIIEKSLSLFDYVLIELMKDGGIRKTEVTATLFSTFLPSIRVRVLKKIINFESLRGDSDEDMFLLDKLFLALTKNGEGKKAIRLLHKIKSKENISDYHVDFWMEKINLIQKKINENLLPIPKNIADCKRNFNDVLSQLTEEEKDKNSILINVFNTMLDQVEPSEMGEMQPNLIILM